MRIKEGVTILEVTIVIGIIILLFALLFPSLNPLKEHTKFIQKTSIISEILSEQRMKAQGGYIGENNRAKAYGIRIKKQQGNDKGGIFATTYDINGNNQTFFQDTYALTQAKENTYNILSDDAYFMEQSTLPPLASVETITLQQNTTSLQGNTIDIVYIPNSNMNKIFVDNTIIPNISSLSVEITSLKIPHLNQKLQLFPSTGTLQKIL